MKALYDDGKVLNIVMEHFSFEMQHTLDQYQDGKLTLEQLAEEYGKGTEGHDIMAYREILEFAREHKDGVKLHGGFIPRSFAKTLMKSGEEAAIKEAKAKDYIAAGVQSFEGTELHYNMFESLITQRNMHDDSVKPQDNFRGNFFKAQLIKDYAMAHCINKLLKNESSEQKQHKYLVLAGKGHLQHFCGVPERVLQENPGVRAETALIVAHESDYEIDLDKNDEQVISGIKKIYGPEGSNPADYLYIYEEDGEEEDEDVAKDGEQVKRETAEAYDRVGQTAHLKGDLRKAKAVMTHLGYSEAEFEIAGEDAYNYQGVGNPHNLAKI